MENSKTVKFPCLNAKLVPAEKVVANDYNPNKQNFCIKKLIILYSDNKEIICI